MSGKILLEVQDLRKDFGDHQVLKGITTKICQGAVQIHVFAILELVGNTHWGKRDF